MGGRNHTLVPQTASGRLRRLVLIFLVSGLCLSGIVYGTWTLAPLHETARDEFISSRDFALLDAIDAGTLDHRDSDRLVYRYSVIPGGAFTSDELRHAIQSDSVVAAHYKDLDQSKLHVRTVARDQYAYVSYRKGDAVYWTKNKVLLRQGETVITDGTTLIRGKCGNCISAAPQLPTAPGEPDVVEFDRLVDPDVPQQARGETPLVAPAPAPVGIPSSEAPVGPITPLTGRLLSVGTTPLAAGNVNQPFNDTDVPPPSVGSVGPRMPLPPFTPQPPDGPPTPPDRSTPPGGTPPPLVPTDDVPPSFFPPNGLPPVGPTGPGDPVPVPEAGTLLLVAAGAATLMRRRRSRAK
jgi:hypothetical protein